ncbi:MAG: GGDEF domain-containing protein [Bacillota bacterium]
MNAKPINKDSPKVLSGGGIRGSRSITLALVYRWLLFLFSAVLCVTSDRFGTHGYSVLESLAVAAVYNGAATGWLLHNGRRHSRLIAYADILAFMLLILFSGGIKSDLFIFLFFIIGLYGIRGNLADTLNTGIASAIMYAAACIASDKVFNDGILYSTLVIRCMVMLLAAFALSKISFEVKRYDEMRKKEFRLARTDKLTGLANRHYLEQKVKEEVEYVKEMDSVLNVLIFDIDDFKSFNDTYGHPSGDKLLMLFADIIRQCIRKSDVPVRYGGEEFLILIRDMDIIIAKSIGDRIRRQLEKQRIYIGQQENKQRVTVSCGIAQYPTHSGNIKEVIEKADQALYHAKEIGKNIVVTFDEITLERKDIEKERTEL